MILLHLTTQQHPRRPLPEGPIHRTQDRPPIHPSQVSTEDTLLLQVGRLTHRRVGLRTHHKVGQLPTHLRVEPITQHRVEPLTHHRVGQLHTHPKVGPIPRKVGPTLPKVGPIHRKEVHLILPKDQRHHTLRVVVPKLLGVVALEDSLARR